MRSFTFGLFFIVIFIGHSLWASGLRYPYVSSLKGAAEWIDKDGKTSKLKNRQVLRLTGRIQTAEGAELRIELTINSFLRVYGRSQVELPLIAWENGEVEQIELKEGRLRYVCDGDCGIVLKTSLVNETFSAGDFILSYNPLVPKTELTVVKGSQVFRGVENEVRHVLQVGQKAAFTGIYESGEIGYDILLKGRRVAKGNLGPIEILKEEELKSFGTEEAKKKLPPPVIKAKKTGKQICSAPFAEFNQCAWICEGNPKKAKDCQVGKGDIKCVRLRCNANGEWMDRLELTAESTKCGAKPIVSACDY